MIEIDVINPNVTLKDIKKYREYFNRFRQKSYNKISERLVDAKSRGEQLDDDSKMQMMILKCIDTQLKEYYGEGY